MAIILRYSRSNTGLLKLLPLTIPHNFSYNSANAAVQPAVQALLARSKVFASSCYDVFSNLAFEDWFYENVDFSSGSHDFLFLWRNNPCVVIGRHQNIWAECNVSEALSAGVHVARRRSGGGTVYHDLGNLNATFFTSRKNYDRKGNLEMIADVLKVHCEDVEVTKRDDIILNGMYKISGTAAKLGAKASYHHCTLLLNADLSSVSKYLQGSPGITSKATASVRMPVANIADVSQDLTYEHTVELLSAAYDSRMMNASKVALEFIDPTNERKFPGIHNLRSKLKSWEWIYGHTPKFDINRSFARVVCGVDVLVTIRASIEKGCISSADIQPSACYPQHSNYVAILCRTTCNALNGVRFWPDSVASIVEWSCRAARSEHKSAIDDDVHLQWTRCISDCFVDLARGH